MGRVGQVWLSAGWVWLGWDVVRLSCTVERTSNWLLNSAEMHNCAASAGHNVKKLNAWCLLRHALARAAGSKLTVWMIMDTRWTQTCEQLAGATVATGGAAVSYCCARLLGCSSGLAAALQLPACTLEGA